MNQLLKGKKIAVLYGGNSSEREVSLKSGKAVYEALISKGYDVILVDAKNNLCEEFKNNPIDIVFIALHGGVGENGAIQGFLEVLGLPYTGSCRLASALAMDKERSKTRFISEGILVSPYKVFKKQDVSKGDTIDVGKIKILIDFPYLWVVKPASEGSSIGVHIIHNDDELFESINDAFSYEDRIIIEKYIKGKEIQIAILNDTVLGGVEVRPASEFYDYQAKYHSGGTTQYIIPPEVSEESYNRLKDCALRAHKALGCKGATRVDLILSEEGLPYVLEVNTIPGMTATSLLPKIAANAGYSFPDLVELITIQAIIEQ
ncbi:MAG: D-alanine--D-alanine ligase [Thermodesulfovibrionales bacterium]|nr:D-alanine--D-alanine ligase [Thermodesulfovibrionales bacterium]